jgi:hypothetical protein
MYTLLLISLALPTDPVSTVVKTDLTYYQCVQMVSKLTEANTDPEVVFSCDRVKKTRTVKM